MELEELKAGWEVLNERLAKNEILNERIVKEMISKRTQSALDKLCRFELFSLGFCTLFTFLLLPLIWLHFGDYTMKPASFILIEILCTCSLVAGVVQLFMITKIRLDEMELCEIVRRSLKYKLFVKKNLLYGTIAGYITIIAYIAIQGFYQNAIMSIAMIAGIITGSIIIYQQYVYYNKNIHALEKGLEELKEFE
ncbi:MAG: hypothetical protein PUB21_10855 [Bacteroidales bacterium]|nr:hypothetical protein [Bacteroidales bacterium]